jgi:hypothetical protein
VRRARDVQENNVHVCNRSAKIKHIFSKMKATHLTIGVPFAIVFWLDAGCMGFARIPHHPVSTSTPSNGPTARRGRASRIWKLHVGAPALPPTRLDRLTESLDQYILTGAPATRKMALDILQEIEDDSAAAATTTTEESSNTGNSSSNNDEELTIARRRMQRAGFNADPRHKIAEQRKQWEESRKLSILSSEGRPSNNDTSSLESPRVQTLSNSQKALHDELLAWSSTGTNDSPDVTAAGGAPAVIVDATAELVSELVAKAGASFQDSGAMGIGGLDGVLAEVKRRVWIPLAAPPRLLKELGISPIRGLLLYGKPGTRINVVPWLCRCCAVVVPCGGVSSLTFFDRRVTFLSRQAAGRRW